MDFLSLFYAPMLLAIRFPVAPFLIAGVFAIAHLLLMWRHRWPANVHMWRRPLLFACSLWLVYGLYELQMQAAFQQVNIRIDLLVLAPILYVFSGAGVWWFLRCWNDSTKGFTQPVVADADSADGDAVVDAVPAQETAASDEARQDQLKR